MLDIENAAVLSASQMTQFSGQSRSRVTSQFTNAISNVVQKVLEYFNGPIIFTFAISALLVLSVILNLNLNESEVFISSSSSAIFP